MMTKTGFLLRRKGLGKTSCEGIQANEPRLSVYRNDTWDFDAVNNEDYDYAIRWGCTANIPDGPSVINKAKAIHFVNDKAASRFEFSLSGLAPHTWLDTVGYGQSNYHGPVVVRPKVHAQGKNLFVSNDYDAVVEMADEYESKHGGYYISELIDKVAEFRVFVAFGRVVWVANKIPGNPEDVAWNVAQGGKFENVKWGEWPQAVLANAISVMNRTGLDFGGVDVMVDGEGGRAYCLEVNSAPSQTSPYRQSCVAKAFGWMLDHGHHNMLAITGHGWRGYIHPGVSDMAVL